MHVFEPGRSKTSFEKKHLFLILIFMFPVGSFMHLHQMLPELPKTESRSLSYTKPGVNYSYAHHRKQLCKGKKRVLKSIYKQRSLQQTTVISLATKAYYKKHLNLKPGLSNQTIVYYSDYQDEIGPSGLI